MPPRFMTVKRLALAAATAFLSINLWTGAPLLALWVGSHSSIGVTLLERIVVASVYLAVIAFLIWFFFYAGSSVPNTF